MDINQFRLDMPEFTDASRYTPAILSLWSALGEELIDSEVYGIEGYKMVIYLFTAHNITLAAANSAAASAGGTPGTIGGAIASKAVGSVNVSYDNASAMEVDAGHWNQTQYGRQFINLVRLHGAGALQL